jgi:hypothetical protein
MERSPVITAEYLQRLDRLFNRLTPEERGMLTLARDHIANLPPEKQRELANGLAQLLDQRIRN